MAICVLVIDDIGLLLNLVESMLYRAGFQVVSATDHLTALAQIEATTPDLIVLDERMPGRSGFVSMARLRQQPIPLLIVTAKGEPTGNLVPAGMVGYLRKPFDQHDLLRKVHELLNSSGR